MVLQSQEKEGKEKKIKRKNLRCSFYSDTGPERKYWEKRIICDVYWLLIQLSSYFWGFLPTLLAICGLEQRKKTVREETGREDYLGEN